MALLIELQQCVKLGTADRLTTSNPVSQQSRRLAVRARASASRSNRSRHTSIGRGTRDSADVARTARHERVIGKRQFSRWRAWPLMTPKAKEIASSVSIPVCERVITTRAGMYKYLCTDNACVNARFMYVEARDDLTKYAQAQVTVTSDRVPGFFFWDRSHCGRSFAVTSPHHFEIVRSRPWGSRSQGEVIMAERNESPVLGS
jgi:hypothetical protein